MNFEKIFENLYDIKQRYENNENIINHINQNILHSDRNALEAIITSYDLQSGSYIETIQEKKDYSAAYTKRIANLIEEHGPVESIMEVGCGELTTLTHVLNQLKHTPENVLGFDISLSRISHGKRYFAENVSQKPHKSTFFCANLFEIPLSDNSINVVYTSHSIEPNGGAEKASIKELYRVSSDYLILLEPSYENNSDEGKKRMDRLGYVKNLKSSIEELGLDLVSYFKFPICLNPLNPTWAHVIKKGATKASANFICPFTKQPLLKEEDSYLAPGLLAYPVITGIPYIMKSHAILAANLKRD